MEVKRSVTFGTAGAIRAQLARDGRDAVLFTDYVSTPVAERLRSLGLQFADAAGNAYFSAPGVLVWVTGRRSPGSRSAPRRSSRAFTASGIRVVFCLLAQPSLADESYRSIAHTADVSLGAVQSVIKDLVDQGYVSDGKARRLLRRDRLLDRWSEFYADVLRPKLEIGRFRSADPGWWRTSRVTDYGGLWGGEPAGALLTDHLRPETSTVYAASLPGRLLIDHRLSRDADGDVEIRRRFWRRDLPSPRADVVPGPLIYADLLAIGDSRTSEIAEMVRERYLD